MQISLSKVEVDAGTGIQTHDLLKEQNWSDYIFLFTSRRKFVGPVSADVLLELLHQTVRKINN